MYFFTFWSLALPIAISLVVSQNPYMLDAMEASPMGLVGAKLAEAKAAAWASDEEAAAKGSKEGKAR